MGKDRRSIIAEGAIEILGKADILAVFPFDGKRVAGSKMKNGRIRAKDMLTVMRGDKEVGRVRVESIRKGRDVVAEVREGEECGILFNPQIAFAVGDVLLSVK
jgi:translation initiation factor IF-2